MFNSTRIDQFKNIPTPFYYYNMELLEDTLNLIKTEASRYGYHIHYAVKANANPKIMKLIQTYGFGADCVSGNEITRSLETGYTADMIVYAGVGKSDREILTALEAGIFCFNCESIPEIELINELAEQTNKTARIAIRINPNVNANTHHYITTGIEENKFGINRWEFESVLKHLNNQKILN